MKNVDVRPGIGENERFDRFAMMRVSARIRPELQTLEFLERLEMCGVLALMECIEAGHSDESIAQAFDMMKERMLRQAQTFRTAQMFIRESKNGSSHDQ